MHDTQTDLQLIRQSGALRDFYPHIASCLRAGARRDREAKIESLKKWQPQWFGGRALDYEPESVKEWIDNHAA